VDDGRLLNSTCSHMGRAFRGLLDAAILEMRIRSVEEQFHALKLLAQDCENRLGVENSYVLIDK
jgi:hypothetical protein